MKKIALAASILVLGMSSTAFAQSCSSPAPLASGQTITNSNFLPTTCGGDNSFTDICGGATLTGPANVYSWTYSSGTPSGNITVTPTAEKSAGVPNTFDVALAVAGPAATCSAALGSCVGSADDHADSTAEAVPLAGATTGSPPGTFYLIVSSFSTTAANQCGPYGLTVGTLPVKLQSFQID